MNDCGFVASPLDKVRDPADFAPHAISINKAHGNMLTNGARNLIFVVMIVSFGPVIPEFFHE